jgi:molybdopterin molybdotransferase
MTTLKDAPWPEARRVAAALGHRGPTETVPLDHADRRIVAGDVAALVDLPGFDSSAMDGWAVCGEGPWDHKGALLAGDWNPTDLEPGHAIRVATGAPVPAGTTGIVRSEDAVLEADGTLSGSGSSDDIRRRGEECRTGDVLAEAGTELTPPLVGLLCAAGHDTVEVVQRPRVRIVLMGDELQDAGLPRPGHVRDALGPQLPAWLDRAGAVVTDRRRLNDSRSDLAQALTDDGVDLIITTGGTASGPLDFVHSAINHVGGHFLVDRVAVRPGHPMVLAQIGETPLVALPGNPQAAVAGLLTLAFPLIDAMRGRKARERHRVQLGELLHAPTDQTRLVGGVITADGFRRSAHAGSAMLRGLAASTGYAVVPPGGAAPGETVEWLPLA